MLSELELKNANMPITPCRISVEKIIGEIKFRILMEYRGGRRIYIPKKPSFNSELSVIISHVQALRLASIYGGCDYCVPNPHSKKRNIMGLIGSGYSISVIAKNAKSTERYVNMVKAEKREASDPKQTLLL